MSFGDDIAALVRQSSDPVLAKADSWERVALAEIATILNGYAWKSDYFNQDEGVPLIRIRDVTTGQTETRYNGPLVEGYWVEKGDLLVGMDGDFNVRRWQADRGLLNQRVCKISTDSSAFVSKLLEYLLPAYLKLINEATSSVTVKHLSSKTLAEIPLPLPPIAEQRLIVAKLDALTERFARARAELNSVLSLTQDLRMRVLQLAFRSGVDGSIYQLDELCSVGTGATPKRGEKRYYHNGTIPWVNSGAVNSKTVARPSVLITPAAIRETNCTVYPAGSLIIALYGEGKTRGKVATLAIDAATNQALAVLHSFNRKLIEPDWARLFLESRYEKTREAASGGVQPNLNLGIIKSIRIPVPSLGRQRTLIAHLTSIHARADGLDAEAVRARALLDKLEPAILAKAFRGELVPQDPDDEPASVLLARIRADLEARPKTTRKGNSSRDQTMTRRPLSARDSLLKDSGRWPKAGLPFAEIARRVSLPHDEMRDALFELMRGSTPVLRQQFDKKREIMLIRRNAT